ncbi:putative Cyclopentanone 1,2-monooxygenase [Glarea lozoyensis 74030]|uniref:Putative Cyclopentanone 1,2-monooxygenase n=1 Tax=Glarea lozoyensis (strain ATCC 74030 / MF5533) TaxID=1104152 RepID=H0EIV9_GLAL7|nr:putative Cyclopentanone 1,2-monooxygenase [Glarea lozoyensis 74030]
MSPAAEVKGNGVAATSSMDVVIVGAGFGGLYQLHYLRKMGYKCKVVDNAGELGGQDWTWSERFPSWPELRRYFQYVDEKLDLSKDVQLNTGVKSAEFDVNSSQYPQEGIELEGKKVAVIGTGASGVQTIQEIGPQVGHLTVLQRTPNLCLPMNQHKLDPEVEARVKKEGGYEKVFDYRRNTFGGFHFDFLEKNGDEDTDEQKKELYEKLWDGGGFRFWLATYKDLLFDKKVNDTAYNFWAEKTRARIKDPKKKDVLAPLLDKQPHTFGTKRPSLEQRYYEVYNQDNVDVVALKATPIETFTEKGIKLKDGRDLEFDVIILATGFDSVTGGLVQIDIKGTDGVSLADKWSKGTWTYLGMTTANFPNMYFLYGPQGPTAFANGPTIVELQGDWIIDAIDYCEKNNKKTMDATAQSEAGWTKHVAELCDITLFPGTDSWYMGANVPGKPRESLNYAGGVPRYVRETKEVAEKGYAGFNFDAPYDTGKLGEKVNALKLN